VKGETVFLL